MSDEPATILSRTGVAALAVHHPIPGGAAGDAVKALRFLAVDAVERADVGHPGTAMALAPFAHAIGHASMLLFGALHLSGYDLSLDDLRRYPTGSRGPGDAASADVAGGWHAPRAHARVDR